MQIRPWIRSDIPEAATILAECNNTDTMSLWLNPYREKNYFSYRKGGLNWLRRDWLQPGRQAFALTVTPQELTNPQPSTNIRLSDILVTSPQTRGDELASKAKGTTEPEIVVGWVWFSRYGTSPTAQKWQQSPSGVGVSLERALMKVEGFITNYIPNKNPSENTQNRVLFRNHPGTEFDPEIFTEFWEVVALDVDPRCQRRGYGKLLLEWVFERAREENVPVCVHGSPRGGPMYRKYGFKSIGDLGFGKLFDELAFGGEPIQSWVWEPEGSEGKWWERAKQKREQDDGKREDDETAKRQQ